MKKIYLVKKNPELPAGRDNWTIMSLREYLEFVKTPEGQARKSGIGQLDGCDTDDVIIYAECGEETAARWRSEKDRHDYLTEARKKAGYMEMSLSGIELSGGDDVNGEELIRDETQDIETTVIVRIMKEKLRVAVMDLDAEERHLIERLFLTADPMTETDYAKEIGTTRAVVNYRKKRILDKLKAVLGND